MVTSPTVRAREALRPGIRADHLRAAAATVAAYSPAGAVSPQAFASPWAAPANLQRIAFQDVFGRDLGECGPLTRAEAMTVPAVARSRHVITGTIGRIKLRGYRGDEVLNGSAEPSWIEQTTGPLSPFHRHLWTADDLYFYGWACWWRTNGADTFPLRADRLPMTQWTFDTAGNVMVDRLDGAGFRYADPRSEVILIPGPHEGLLNFAYRSVRIAANIERAVDTASRTPAAMLALRQVSGDPLPMVSDDPNVVTVPSLVQSWVDARHGRNGGVGYLSAGVEAQELGTFDAHLLVEGRNASAVDIARHSSIPADLIDASTSGADLTYANSRDNDRRAIDYGFGPYMGSISGRLTMDDVTPRGQRVAFDTEEWLEGTAAPGQPAGPPARPGVPGQPVPSPEPPQ
jgi:hypothetical protein